MTGNDSEVQAAVHLVMPFRLGLILGLAVSMLCLLSCTPPPVRIALMTKLEAGSLVGISEVNAVRLAVEDAGMGGQVEVVPYNDGWIPEGAEKAWRELRASGIDIVVTSHVSTCALVVAELAKAEDVIILVTGATTNALTGLDDRIIRTINDVRSEQTAIARWAESRGYSSILVLRDTDNWAYTQPAIESFAGIVGSEKLRVIEVSAASPDLERLKAAMVEAPFDLLYLLVGGSQTIAGTFAQLGRLIQPNCAILFTPWMKTPDLMQTAGPALKGAWIPSYYPPRGADPRVDAYMSRYRDRYGYAPNFISLNVYAAVELILQNIAAGRRTPAKMKEALVETSWVTAFGELFFDSTGDVERPLYLIDDIAGEF